LSNNFEDIKIIAFDDKATYKSDPNSALMHAVLNLSASAPYEWSNYFNQRWNSHIYAMKRKASVSGKRLEIYCVPDELQNDHIPELNRVIAEANQAYRQYLAKTKREADSQASREAAEKAKLAEIKNNLRLE
jgi:hypothetical protein